MTNYLQNQPIYTTSIPSEDYAYIFSAGKDITIGNAIIATYSKGIYIPLGSDAILISVDYTLKTVIGFRNGGTWSAKIL